MESEEATLRRQARQREYYLKHREKLLAYSRKYIKEHPEKQKLYRENAAKSPRKGEGVPAQILPEEKRSSEEREEDNAESRYR